MFAFFFWFEFLVNRLSLLLSSAIVFSVHPESFCVLMSKLLLISKHTTIILTNHSSQWLDKTSQPIFENIEFSGKRKKKYYWFVMMRDFVKLITRIQCVWTLAIVSMAHAIDNIRVLSSRIWKSQQKRINKELNALRSIDKRITIMKVNGSVNVNDI